MERKQLLKLACAADGISQAELARRIGVSKPVLSCVASGKEKSERVSHEIDRYIAKMLPKIKTQLRAA